MSFEYKTWIVVIAVIALNRETKNVPRIDADDRGSRKEPNLHCGGAEGMTQIQKKEHLVDAPFF
jgi:hypothetical protein